MLFLSGNIPFGLIEPDTQKPAGLASEASYSKTRCVKRKCKTNHLWCWCRGGGKMSVIHFSLQLPCSLVPGPETKLPFGGGAVNHYNVLVVMATHSHSHGEGEECSCVLHSSAVAQTLDVG